MMETRMTVFLCVFMCVCFCECVTILTILLKAKALYQHSRDMERNTVCDLFKNGVMMVRLQVLYDLVFLRMCLQKPVFQDISSTNF